MSIDHVNTAPEKIWHFLTHLHEGDTYLRWRPTDHKAFKILHGDSQTVGSTFNAVEMIGGKRFSLKYRVNRVEPQKYIGWLIRRNVNLPAINKYMDEEGYYLNKALTTKEG